MAEASDRSLDLTPADDGGLLRETQADSHSAELDFSSTQTGLDTSESTDASGVDLGSTEETWNDTTVYVPEPGSTGSESSFSETNGAWDPAGLANYDADGNVWWNAREVYAAMGWKEMTGPDETKPWYESLADRGRKELGTWSFVASHPSSWDDVLVEYNKGLGQGVLNVANGLQDTAIGMVNMSIMFSPFTAPLYWTCRFDGVDLTIPSPDWSRGLITHEAGEPAAWSDTHGWSEFLGARGVEILVGSKGAGKASKLLNEGEGLLGKAVNSTKTPRRVLNKLDDGIPDTGVASLERLAVESGNFQQKLHAIRRLGYEVVEDSKWLARGEFDPRARTFTYNPTTM